MEFTLTTNKASVDICRDLWRSVGICGYLWGSVGIFGHFLVPLDDNEGKTNQSLVWSINQSTSESPINGVPQGSHIPVTCHAST